MLRASADGQAIPEPRLLLALSAWSITPMYMHTLLPNHQGECPQRSQLEHVNMQDGTKVTMETTTHGLQSGPQKGQGHPVPTGDPN